VFTTLETSYAQELRRKGRDFRPLKPARGSRQNSHTGQAARHCRFLDFVDRINLQPNRPTKRDTDCASRVPLPIPAHPPEWRPRVAASSSSQAGHRAVRAYVKAGDSRNRGRLIFRRRRLVARTRACHFELTFLEPLHARFFFSENVLAQSKQGHYRKTIPDRLLFVLSFDTSVFRTAASRILNTLVTVQTSDLILP